MKKLLLLLLCVPLMFSCGDKGEKKDNFMQIDLIKEPCDCVDQMVGVFNQVLSMLKNESRNIPKYEDLMSQSEKIQEYCREIPKTTN